MKAAVYRRYGPAREVVGIEDVPVPTPGEGEMLVRVMAASLNSWDWDKLSGNVFGRMDGPFGPRHKVLGADIAGVVEAVGPGVTRFKAGDEVFGDLTESGWGGLAEFARAKEKFFTLKPKGIGFPEAASVPQAGLLALQGLRDFRTIEPGDAVLVNGGGGGMGSFAIQLAKLKGAQVTGVDRRAKAALMLAQGADHAIDSERQDFAEAGEQYDLVIDAVARRSVGTHLKVLKPGGRYVVIGGTARSLLQNVIFGGSAGRKDDKRVGLLMWQPKTADMDELAAMIEAGTIKPAIERVYPLTEAATALDRLGAREVLGKAVVAPGL
jgi:NADPH:quinone reductase-like Zn-dependent oxidoreductase